MPYPSSSTFPPLASLIDSFTAATTSSRGYRLPADTPSRSLGCGGWTVKIVTDCVIRFQRLCNCHVQLAVHLLCFDAHGFMLCAGATVQVHSHDSGVPEEVLGYND
jgi:hypothetical protein